MRRLYSLRDNAPRRNPVSVEKAELIRIREELATITLALSVLAVNQSGSDAANADARKRQDTVTQKGINLLLEHIEGL